MIKTELIPSEHVEQTQLFAWARFQSSKYPQLDLMYAIPNGGKRAMKTANDLKAEGVKAGVSDIFLPYASAGFHGLYIEMKRIKGSHVEKSQIDFIDSVRKNGYAATICYGFEQARDILMSYIKGTYKNDILQLTASRKKQ